MRGLFRKLSALSAVILAAKVLAKAFIEGRSLLPDMETVVKAFAPSFIPAVTPLGLFTGKAVKIFKEEAPHEAFGFDELGLKCDSPLDCEKVLADVLEKLSEALGGDDIDDALTRAREALAPIGDERIRETLIHEALHSFIARGTSALTIMESMAWRVRFDLLYVMERTYQALGRALAEEVGRFGFKARRDFRVIDGFAGLGREEVNEVLDKVKPKLRGLSLDAIFGNALRDGYQHHLSLKTVIHSIVAPVVELVTWYVLGYDLEETLETYYERGVFREGIHGSVFEGLIDLLEERRPKPQQAVEAARATLDFPLSTYEKLRAEIKEIGRSEDADKTKPLAMLVKGLIVPRFEAALDGRPLERAPPHQKTLGEALLYAIPTDEVPDFIPRFAEILREEVEILKALLRVQERRILEKLVGTYPAFYIDVYVEGRRKTVGHNPISVLFGTPVRRTDSRLGTLEDIVGDLVLPLRGFLGTALTMARSKEGVAIVARYSGVDEGRLEEVALEVRRRAEAFENLLHADPSPQHVEEVLEAFLYAVLRLGESIKGFGGLHGLWIL